MKNAARPPAHTPEAAFADRPSSLRLVGVVDLGLDRLHLDRREIARLGVGPGLLIGHAGAVEAGHEGLALRERAEAADGVAAVAVELGREGASEGSRRNES